VEETDVLTIQAGQPLLSQIDGGEDVNTSRGRLIRGDDIEAQDNGLSYSTFPTAPSDVSASSTSNSRPKINPRIIADAILGLSDGLTVPFALSAGLSALGDTKVVVLGGLAELAAGAISMGLGGYTGARSESLVETIRDGNPVSCLLLTGLPTAESRTRQPCGKPRS